MKVNNYFKARKFLLTYDKEDGNRETTFYRISLPIEVSANTVTTYVFGRGIRSFKKKNIKSIEELV
jgi:hypothetical protein